MISTFRSSSPIAGGGNQYELIKMALRGLVKSALEIEIDREWEGYPLLSKAKYSDKTKIAKLRFAPEMMPFFLHLQGSYTSYLLKDVDRFQKSYSIRVYELCRQYYPKIKEREMELGRLKFLLSVEKKYSRWGDFKTRVLLPSLKEINDHSDIFVDFEPVKRGRSVSGVLFKISTNKNYKGGEITLVQDVVQDVAHEVHEATGPDQMAERVPAWINDNQYQILVKSFGETSVKAGIETIELKGDEVKSPRSYLMKGLQEGWFSASERSGTEKATKVIQAQKVDERRSIERQEAIVREFDAKRNEFLQGLEVDGDSIEMFVFQHLESEESYLRKIAGQLSRGGRAQMAMKQVAVWMVNQNPGNYTEEELMLANSEIRPYAMKVLGHRWVG